MNYKKRTYKNERIKKLYYKNNNWSTYRDEGGGTDPWGRALKKAPPPAHVSAACFCLVWSPARVLSFIPRDTELSKGGDSTNLRALRDCVCLSTLRFYLSRQWPCSPPGQLWEMTDSNPGPATGWATISYQRSMQEHKNKVLTDKGPDNGNSSSFLMFFFIVYKLKDGNTG